MQINVHQIQGPRDYQQDSYLIKKIDNCWLLAVADGMGGHANGDLASKEVIERLEELIDEEFLTTDDVKEKLREAHSNMLDAYDGRGTTATVAIIKDGLFHIVHSGDTRFQRVNKFGVLSSVTEDMGYGSRLEHALGFSTKFFTYHVPINDNEQYLISSDGFHDYLSWESQQNISDCFLEDNPAEALVQLVEKTTKDNVTVITIK